MKKLFFVSLFVLLCTLSINAYSAEEGWYVSGNAGVSLIKDIDLGVVNEASLEVITNGPLPTGTAAQLGLEFGMGWDLGVAVGYDYGSFRLEGELFYSKNDIDKINGFIYIPPAGPAVINQNITGKITAPILLANGYYDFIATGNFHPYITAGAGFAYETIDIEGQTESYTEFVYQAGFGIKYDLNEKTSLDFKYRYMNLSEPEENIELEGSLFTVGVIHYF